MFLYWRIQQDLNEIGSFIIFHHPGFALAFEKWVRKNAGGLAMAEYLNREELLKRRISSN
jgi:hypothetical protein